MGDMPLLRRRMNMQRYLLSRSVSAPFGANALRRGCGYGSRIALQSTFDQSAGSPGTPALLQVRLISGNFLQWKAIDLHVDGTTREEASCIAKFGRGGRKRAIIT